MVWLIALKSESEQSCDDPAIIRIVLQLNRKTIACVYFEICTNFSPAGTNWTDLDVFQNIDWAIESEWVGSIGG